MTRKKRAKPAPGSRRLILVFGEDEHDRLAIATLVRALRPGLRVQPIRQPLVLIKGALPETARQNAEEIAAQARDIAAGGEVLAVLAHQDCDACQPADVAVANRLEEALAAAGCPGTPIGVAPAWEIEAWWMVFPEAVQQVVEGWRAPTGWLGHDVGMVQDAKEALCRALRPVKGVKGKRVRDYEENDSIATAENIVSLGLLASFDGDHRETPGRGTAKQRTKCTSFGAVRRKVLAL